ncbi:MAG: EAL domain-containing protein [Hyphomicrobiaceae bacterium]|nr:EAL domain-containing protein [Hyphomicrobiaceae bacterium]
MPKSLSTSSLIAKAALSWKLPMLALAIALVGTIWVAALLQIASERQAMRQTLTQETSNLALVFEQNTERTASEIDRIIRYLRSSYERQGYTADWPTLVMEEFTANRRTVQIAIMDVNGMMITSTKMLHPKTPVDLSDREHYRVHANAGRFVDRLFISKPVLGRASNKWSVQFTRPYPDAKNNFAGVIVVSLDPEFLTRNFSALNLGDEGGLAIVGEDGIVRSGAGSFHNNFDKPIGNTLIREQVQQTGDTATIKVDELADGPRITAVREVAGFPLKTVVSRSDVSIFDTWKSNRLKYIWGAIAFSVAIIIAVLTSFFRRKAYELQLDHLARHDGLTDLLNRREFSDRLTRYLTGRREAGFNVLLVDLDLFKRVNDTYGHPVGDAVLVETGTRLIDSIGYNNVVARLGGDEFAVLQENVNRKEAAIALAAKLCRVLSEPYTIDGKRIEVGASVGIVSGCNCFDDEDHLMRSADLALYAAKNSGGGAYRVYDEQMNEAAQERRELEAGLRDAIALNQLEVHYQPIFDLGTLEMSCVEALIRWRHPKKGLISPADFIPVAEQSGLIVEIGSWVMKKACREICERSASLQVAVNVSAVEFRDGDVLASVREAIATSGINPERIKVEITESLLMNKDRATLFQLDQIRDLGIHISMDDFGTGYSSLSYLQSYPIDCIKIDRAFVSGLDKGGSSAAIIEAIARLANALGMTTVAEGVETDAQLDLLKEIGCTEAQGYLLGKPARIDDILPIADNEPSGEPRSEQNKSDNASTQARSKGFTRTTASIHALPRRSEKKSLTG